MACIIFKQIAKNVGYTDNRKVAIIIGEKL